MGTAFNLMSIARIALITGSGRKRLGNVVAGDLAADGFSIALHYNRSADEAREAVTQLRDAGVDAEAYQADVADDDDVGHLFDQILERFGRLDVLVNTASIWQSRSLEETTAQDVRQSFDVNCLGTFLCARRAGLIMAGQQSGGVIVNIGDWAIQRPYADHAAYFIAKGAIPTLTRVLAVELARRNPKIRVNCIHPGPVMFPPGMSDAEQRKLIEATLVKQANCPHSISQAVRFFIENQFVTGVCLPVDGGRTIYAAE